MVHERERESPCLILTVILYFCFSSFPSLCHRFALVPQFFLPVQPLPLFPREKPFPLPLGKSLFFTPRVKPFSLPLGKSLFFTPRGKPCCFPLSLTPSFAPLIPDRPLRSSTLLLPNPRPSSHPPLFLLSFPRHLNQFSSFPPFTFDTKERRILQGTRGRSRRRRPHRCLQICRSMVASRPGHALFNNPCNLNRQPLRPHGLPYLTRRANHVTRCRRTWMSRADHVTHYSRKSTGLGRRWDGCGRRRPRSGSCVRISIALVTCYKLFPNWQEAHFRRMGHKPPRVARPRQQLLSLSPGCVMKPRIQPRATRQKGPIKLLSPLRSCLTTACRLLTRQPAQPYRSSWFRSLRRRWIGTSWTRHSRWRRYRAVHLRTRKTGQACTRRGRGRARGLHPAQSWRSWRLPLTSSRGSRPR